MNKRLIQFPIIAIHANITPEDAQVSGHGATIFLWLLREMLSTA